MPLFEIATMATLVNEIIVKEGVGVVIIALFYEKAVGCRVDR